MKCLITAISLLALTTTVLASCAAGFSLPSDLDAFPTPTSLSLPSQFPGQGTGTGRGPTGKCLFGRNYCGFTIRDLHTYEDLKEVYCNSPLCPFEYCSAGKTCTPTENDINQSVYQCDDRVGADGEGSSVFFLGACAGSGWICVNPEPHCKDPSMVRNVKRGLHR